MGGVGMHSKGGIDDSVVGKTQGKHAIVEADLAIDFEQDVARFASLRLRRGGVGGPFELEYGSAWKRKMVVAEAFPGTMTVS